MPHVTCPHCGERIGYDIVSPYRCPYCRTAPLPYMVNPKIEAFLNNMHTAFNKIFATIRQLFGHAMLMAPL